MKNRYVHSCTHNRADSPNSRYSLSTRQSRKRSLTITVTITVNSRSVGSPTTFPHLGTEGRRLQVREGRRIRPDRRRPAMRDRRVPVGTDNDTRGLSGRVADDRLARARPPLRGSVRVGSVCVAGRVSDRGRQPRSQSRAEAGPLPWGPDPTGGSAAASGPPGRTGPPRGRCGGGCGGRLRYRTLHYANARVRTPTDHGLSVSIPISGVSA